MTKGYEPLDPKGLRTVPLGLRQSKVHLAQTGRAWKAGGSFAKASSDVFRRGCSSVSMDRSPPAPS